MQNVTKSYSKRLAGRLVKVCIIGDSHVGALKKAWAVIDRTFPGIRITFFALPALALDSVVAANGTLCSVSEGDRKALEFISGGKSHIDPGEYDVFLVYGCGARATFVPAV